MENKQEKHARIKIKLNVDQSYWGSHLIKNFSYNKFQF